MVHAPIALVGDQFQKSACISLLGNFPGHARYGIVGAFIRFIERSMLWLLDNVMHWIQRVCLVCFVLSIAHMIV